MGESVRVSFPNLDLDLNVSRVAFKVFDFPIYWYGIIIALAFLICILWAMKDSEKFGLSSETIIDLMIFVVPVAIIFARLYYVIFSWEDYRYDLKEIINFRNGGLAIYGGIIGALLMACFVARYKKIKTFKLFDVYIPYVALGQAIGRWGNFFNQEAFGTNTDLPWGMFSASTRAYLLNNKNQISELYGITVNPDLPVHPTFLYESILNLIVFAFLLFVRKKKKFDGEVICFYFVTYSLGRAVIEGLRTDSLMLGSIRISQWLSILLVLIFGTIVAYNRLKIKNTEDSVVPADSGYADVLKALSEQEALEELREEVSLEDSYDSYNQDPDQNDDNDVGQNDEAYDSYNQENNQEEIIDQNNESN